MQLCSLSRKTETALFCVFIGQLWMWQTLTSKTTYSALVGIYDFIGIEPTILCIADAMHYRNT